MYDRWYLVVGRWGFQYEHGVGCFRIVCCMDPISGVGFVGDRYCRIWIVMIGQMFQLFRRKAQHQLLYLVGGWLGLVGNAAVFLRVGWVGVLRLVGGCHRHG